MVSTPSQPGGMRTSTNAIAYGRPCSSARRTISSPSWPWKAESISKPASPGRSASSPNNSARAEAIGLSSPCGRRILRKSSWIARLSSMIRMRRLVRMFILVCNQVAGDFQREGGATARAFALGAQGAAQFLGRQRAAVQAKTVAISPGREAVVEYAREILRRYSHAVIRHRDPDPVRSVDHAHGQPLVGTAGFVAGVFGVAHEVDQDLQHLVFLGRNRRHLGVVALDLHPVALERSGVQAQAVLDEIGHLDGLPDARHLGVALLHVHDILDVFDVLAE